MQLKISPVSARISKTEPKTFKTLLSVTETASMVRSAAREATSPVSMRLSFPNSVLKLSLRFFLFFSIYQDNTSWKKRVKVKRQYSILY